MLLVLLPLLTSVVVRTFAWIVVLGRQGIVNQALLGMGVIQTPLRLLYTEGGVVAALTQVQMPLMVLPLIAALGRIGPDLPDAAGMLGAGIVFQLVQCASVWMAARALDIPQVGIVAALAFFPAAAIRSA